MRQSRPRLSRSSVSVPAGSSRSQDLSLPHRGGFSAQKLGVLHTPAEQMLCVTFFLLTKNSVFFDSVIKFCVLSCHVSNAGKTQPPFPGPASGHTNLSFPSGLRLAGLTANRSLCLVASVLFASSLTCSFVSICVSRGQLGGQPSEHSGHFKSSSRSSSRGSSARASPVVSGPLALAAVHFLPSPPPWTLHSSVPLRRPLHLQMPEPGESRKAFHDLFQV